MSAVLDWPGAGLGGPGDAPDLAGDRLPKILCVDDEPNVLSGLARQLGWDYEVVTAEGPFLALERIKGRDESPIVVMVTANEGKRHQAYAESLGVDRYLLKPLPLGTLLDTAVELIEARG